LEEEVGGGFRGVAGQGSEGEAGVIAVLFDNSYYVG
jgi:hypothetical protein